MEIKAGVTVMQRFCRPGTNVFKSYIDYIDRAEAQRNNAIQTYNLYHDYMGNPEKTTGLFTSEKDSLTQEDKKELKNIFSVAQKNDSIMWQTVISFDNRWLEQNGLYDSAGKMLDERKIKEVTRMSVNRMLEKEGLENAVWSASIHYNTDNFHVHVAIVEPYPMREIKIYKGNFEYRGKFKLKNIEACKSCVVNEIMHTKEINIKINTIIREQIVKQKQERKLAEDPDIRTSFLKLYESLPNAPRNMLNYNNSIMHKCRPLIDNISKIYLEKYHSREYAELLAVLKRQSDLYSEAYGKSDRTYEESKKKELMERLGNAILKEVKVYGDSMNKKLEGVNIQNKPLSMPQRTAKRRLDWDDVTKDTDGGVKKEPIKGHQVEFDYNESTIDESQIEQEDFSLKLNVHQQRTEITKELQWEMEQIEGFLNPNVNENESGKYQAFKKSGMYGKSEIEKKYGRWFTDFKILRMALNPKEGKEINLAGVVNGIAMGEKAGNPFIIYLKAELMQSGRVPSIDLDNAQQCFAKAFEIFRADEPELFRECKDSKGFRFDQYVQYRIGKQYNRGLGIEENNMEAAHWFEKSDTSYAKYALGNLYYYGEGVEQDFEVAFDLYEQTSNVNAFSALKCAGMYKKGVGCELSFEEAGRYFEEAFSQFIRAEEEQPDELYEYQIGRMLYVGEGCVPNLAQSIEYLEKAAKKKNIYAEYLVSKIYINESIEEKLPKAIEQLTELADKRKLSNAQYALGKLYTDENKEEYYDIEKGVAYLKTACSQGHEYAQYHIGKLYTDSESEIYNLYEGIKYFELSAEQGNEFAQYRLGKLFIDPALEVYDIKKGISYLEQAAEQKNEFALYQLGKLYTNPELEIYDFEKGVRYLQQSAEQENEYAQYYLGKMYVNPQSGIYDMQKGIDYMERAAFQGNENAQYRLGKLYINSENAEVYDLEKGIRYLEVLKENGNAQAQYILGIAYLDKEGEAYNPKKGISYITELSEKGNMYAQTKLGCEYLKGMNIQRDINAARIWFSEAAKQGDKFAEDILNDMQEAGAGKRIGHGELDKALRALQRSMDEEHQETLRSIREYEMEQERELEELEVR